MKPPLEFPADPTWARQCFPLLEIIWEHNLREELAAEMRATAPQTSDEDVCWGGAWMHAMDLAHAIPETMMPRKQAESLAMEYVGGSRRKAYLKALETVAALAKQQPEPQPEPIEEPEECPPEPPGEWRSEHQGQAPIEIKSAAEPKADDYVPRWERRKAGGK